METKIKVGDILQSSMVNDNTVVCISKPLGIPDHYLHRKGHWYEDWCLGFGDDVVTKLTYIRDENKVYLEVKEAGDTDGIS